MMVLILERVGASLRGELSRWMLEPKAGVFVGRVSAMVRERLWDRVCKDAGSKAGATMIYRAENEQGYLLQNWGDPSRMVEDFEGLQLIRIRSSGRSISQEPSPC